MSERLEHQEGLPKMNLNVDNGETLAATPENTILFTHLGRLAMYDHVFVTTTQEQETSRGIYVFAEFMRQTFTGMQEFMLENGYPAFVNKREVPDCDLDAFEQILEKHSAEMPDTFPEDWQ